MCVELRRHADNVVKLVEGLKVDIVNNRVFPI